MRTFTSNEMPLTSYMDVSRDPYIHKKVFSTILSKKIHHHTEILLFMHPSDAKIIGSPDDVWILAFHTILWITCMGVFSSILSKGYWGAQKHHYLCSLRQAKMYGCVYDIQTNIMSFHTSLWITWTFNVLSYNLFVS